MGSPDSNWFRWLETALQRRGYEVWLPALPNAQHPSLREAADYVRQQVPFPIDDQTLIIGHSSGAILALILSQEAAVGVGGVVAVSVFHDNSLNWEANDRLFDVPLKFEVIRAKAQKLLFVHSDDDPYVPLEQAQFVADKCHAEMVVVSGQGHFNLEQSNAYREFPKLVELLAERHFL